MVSPWHPSPAVGLSSLPQERTVGVFVELILAKLWVLFLCPAFASLSRLPTVKDHEILLGVSKKAVSTMYTTKNVAMHSTVNSFLGNTVDQHFTTNQFLLHSTASGLF